MNDTPAGVHTATPDDAIAALFSHLADDPAAYTPAPAEPPPTRWCTPQTEYVKPPTPKHPGYGIEWSVRYRPQGQRFVRNRHFEKRADAEAFIYDLCNNEDDHPRRLALLDIACRRVGRWTSTHILRSKENGDPYYNPDRFDLTRDMPNSAKITTAGQLDHYQPVTTPLHHTANPETESDTMTDHDSHRTYIGALLAARETLETGNADHIGDYLDTLDEDALDTLTIETILALANLMPSTTEELEAHLHEHPETE